MSEIQATVENFWKAMESGRLEELDAIVDPDCHFKMPGADISGLAAMKPLLAAYMAAFPDLRHDVKNAVASGDAIALELLVTGTHTGPMHTAKGAVPATGRKIVWESCDYVRVRNGRVVSWHGYYDNVPFLAALGLIDAPA
jgi:steroid delta-isomerase-like uncharacterized protein